MKQKEKKKRITRRWPKCSFHFLLHLHQHRNKTTQWRSTATAHLDWWGSATSPQISTASTKKCQISRKQPAHWPTGSGTPPFQCRITTSERKTHFTTWCLSPRTSSKYLHGGSWWIRTGLGCVLREQPEKLRFSTNLHDPTTEVEPPRCWCRLTCWLGGVAWGVCPVGGACPPLLSTTGMLGDVVLWWGLNESCQSTAFLFNTHTLLIPPQPEERRANTHHQFYIILNHSSSSTLVRHHSGGAICWTGEKHVVVNEQWIKSKQLTATLKIVSVVLKVETYR